MCVFVVDLLLVVDIRRFFARLNFIFAMKILPDWIGLDVVGAVR